MIDRREVVEAARILSLRPQVVEKDYVLGWVLAGMFAQPGLATSWVFKGGTCLKKCFFETYRFSEDLDFTIRDPGMIDESFLMEAFTKVCAWVYEQSGIETFPDRLRFDVYKNPRGEASCEGRFYYRGPVSPRGDPPMIKLDITADELLALEPVTREVAHPYSDIPSGGIHTLCYAFEEIFGEKLRALGERCRPRDLYDVVHLFRRDDADPDASSVLEVLKAKCEFKDILVPSPESLVPRREELDAAWSHMLVHQLQVLPPVDDFWDTLPALFSWLEGSAVRDRPERLEPQAAASTVSRNEALPSAGQLPMGASAMESVFFAAANRLCVDIGYKGRVRRIEPYSLRRTKDANLLLYGSKADTGEIRAYRVDRIESAAATNQSFTPRYAIELTGSGPVSIRRASSGRRSTRSPAATRLRSNRRPGGRYVHECLVCGRRFTRKTRSNALKPHVSKGGSPCPGRRAVLIETR